MADILSENDIELGEIEFFANWVAPGSESTTQATLEKVRELAVATGGGDHLSSGDFADGPLGYRRCRDTPPERGRGSR